MSEEKEFNKGYKTGFNEAIDIITKDFIHPMMHKKREVIRKLKK